MDTDETLAFGGLRVLDLADEQGHYCTKLLADLGADVIKVEPPGGHPTRRIGPFLHNHPHPEKSLFFAYYNTNKRSITLNLACTTGQDLFRRLASRTDIVVETFAPGYLKALGLDYAVLQELNPRLILTSITPFGQTGPHSHYHGADIVGLASGGLMYLTGDPDTPPLQAFGWQAYLVAGAFAAVATLVALYWRRASGEGQHADVSIQECVASLLETASIDYAYTGHVQTRIGSRHAIAFPCQVYPCKDGHWALMAFNPQMWRILAAWMAEDGIEEVSDPKYEDREVRRGEMDKVNAAITRFGMNHTKRELLAEGQRRRLSVAPLSTVQEVVTNIHLRRRGYFVPAEHPLLGKLDYPGAPYKLSETPWGIRRPAPLVGQDNEAVYGELGLSQGDLMVLRETGVI